MLRAIQVENEALQRVILSRKAEPPASALQVQVRPGQREGTGEGARCYSGTRQCLSSACTEHVGEARVTWEASLTCQSFHFFLLLIFCLLQKAQARC